VRAAVAALALAACSTRMPSPRDPGQVDDDDAVLWFTAVQVAENGDPGTQKAAGVPDAALWIDGSYVGTLGLLRGGVAVEPGPHRVEIRHDDYFSHYAEITLASRERKRFQIELAPVLR